MDTSPAKTTDKIPSGIKRQHHTDSDNGNSDNGFKAALRKYGSTICKEKLMRKNFEINLIMLENSETTSVYNEKFA